MICLKQQVCPRTPRETLSDHIQAIRLPNQRCLGFRPYDPVKKAFGPYQWLDYQTVQRRRAAFGVGLVELHKQLGVTDEQYGVGLLCQNRPEWQITGKRFDDLIQEEVEITCLSSESDEAPICRSPSPRICLFLFAHTG